MFYEYQRSVGEHYLRIREKGSEGFDFPLHLHKSFELVSVEAGVMTVHIAGTDHAVQAGEMAIIFPGQLHAYSSPEHCLCRLCIFSPDYLPDLEPGHHPVFSGERGLLDRLYECRENRFAVKAVLYSLAAQYVQGAPYAAAEAETNDLICRVVQYIEEHFADEITLRSMAEELGYNYRYLSGVVNRCFKTTFPRVVNRFRVDLACRLLKKENGSITGIGARCGFDSLRNFNRCFKEITGKTPKEYKETANP
ncbi:MAG: helix-turn-helix transcriptional regulator [Clostridia bacterium]|nr:helix-turn-helix transcriptional regulator [Clostridia bacterium]